TTPVPLHTCSPGTSNGGERESELAAFPRADSEAPVRRVAPWTRRACRRGRGGCRRAASPPPSGGGDDSACAAEAVSRRLPRRVHTRPDGGARGSRREDRGAQERQE